MLSHCIQSLQVILSRPLGMIFQYDAFAFSATLNLAFKTWSLLKHLLLKNEVPFWSYPYVNIANNKKYTFPESTICRSDTQKCILAPPKNI